MGLYDDRLLELSEPRRDRRVAARPEPSMSAQSLLFDRNVGWTASKATAWAKSHGYRYGKVDVTDQYVRIRQFDPKGFKVKRTIPFGRGIRAVVAREETSMRTTTARKSPRRHRAKKSAKKSARRAAPKRRVRRAKKVHAVATRRRRRKVRVEAKRSSHVMEAKRRTRRRRPARAAEAWKGDSAGHAKAARKGHKRRRAAKATRKHGRRRSKARETTYAAAPKRRRSRRAHAATPVMETSRRRRYHARASKRGGSGMGPAEFGMAIVSAGFGFILADGLDRMLATYDPSSTDPKPTDRFTSDGAGTLANTLNVAAMPDWKRLVAGVAVTAVPAIGSMYVKNPLLKSSAEGLAIGAGVSLFKTLWSNVLMPLLVGKDTSSTALKKSYIARLYPAEVAAHINSKKTDASGAAVTPNMNATAAPGALSGADVGPFALAETGMGASAAGGLLPTVQNTWGTGASAAGGSVPRPERPSTSEVLHTAAQAMGTGAPYEPGPPAGPGPGPQPMGGDAACGCIGDDNQFLGFVGDEPAENTLLMSN